MFFNSFCCYFLFWGGSTWVVLGKSFSIFKLKHGWSCFLEVFVIIFDFYMGVPWSTWEYLGVLLLFCVFECRVPGSTWKNLGVLGSTWEYHLRISPADFIHKVYQKFTLVWLCLRVIDFDWNLWWHKWHLNFITQILAFFKEIKTIFNIT